MQQDGDLTRFGCARLVRGAQGQVLVRKEAFEEIKALEPRQQAQLLARMSLWANGRSMTKEQFNGNEGRCKKGDINRLLQVFKVHKVRLFGFVRPINLIKSFIVVDVDPAKKQDRANRRILSRAMDRVISFEEEFGGLA
jgi:hypothetical protein